MYPQGISEFVCLRTIFWSKSARRFSYVLRVYSFPTLFLYIKPWPIGVASRCKLKTWVYLLLRLARPWVHLRWLACTCDDLRWLALTLVEIKFARKSKQVFHRLATQTKSRQVEWRPLTYYSGERQQRQQISRTPFGRIERLYYTFSLNQQFWDR